ncbi:MAG: PQQ-binding-like beta-propeller repeat protein [Armatimonadetes bacterium]|nr:PQQ-binding-like beta-propeller repeat protein [Armatimonadota bacterium]
MDGSGYQGYSVVKADSTCTSSATTIDGFKIQGGQATGSDAYGGGIRCEDSSPTISNNTVTGNIASQQGGGIHSFGGAPRIVNNTISANSTQLGAGGGINVTNSSAAEILNNWITKNTAGSEGGGISCDFYSSPNVANNTITGNSASNGGGIYCGLYSTTTLTNNTIAGNTASASGGGIYFDSGITSSTTVNNIVASNSSEVYNTGSDPTFQNNCVWNPAGSEYNYSGSDPTGQNGNISEDPKLVSVAEENFHIQPNSPCKDAGNNGAVQTGWVDMDGEDRIQNSTVDIGADESDGCGWYYISMSADPELGQVSGSVTVTATVTDWNGQHPYYATVCFFVTGGTLTHINGSQFPPGSTSGCGYTNINGVVTATVTRQTPGKLTVTAVTVRSCGLGSTSESLEIWFFDTAPDDWPMFMHDAQHTGMSRTWDVTDETLTTTAWTPVSVSTAQQTLRASESQPVWSVQIIGQTVYHPNPAGGNTWIFAHPYIDSSPVVVGSKVVVGTWSGDYLDATGSVKAFNAADNGATLWTATGTPSMGGVASTPCIVDQKVYVGSSNGYLYCLSLSDGSQIWSRPTYDRTESLSKIISSPVVHNGVVYITNEASKVYAFSADANGTRIWSDEPNEAHDYLPIILPIDESGHGNDGNGVTGLQQKICGTSSPAIATVGENTYLLVGCDDGYIYRIKLSDRSVAGIDVDACVESSPTVVGNEAYVGASRYHGINAYRLSIEPFEILEAQEVSYLGSAEEIRGTMASGFGRLYVGMDTGITFHELLPDSLEDDDDEFVATNYFVGSAALASNGLAYVGNDDGKLYALNTHNINGILSQEAAYTGYQNSGFICSSPAISYNVTGNDRWVFVTTRADGGKLLAFRTDR